MSTYSIGKLARAAQVSVDTIRFYERIGLLPKPARTPAGYRQYSDSDLRRVRFVRSARNFGLSLADIGALVKIELERDESAPAALRPRLAKLDESMTVLQEWRSSLRDWLHGAGLTADEVTSQFRSLAESDLTDPQICPGEPGGCRCVGAPA